jgi:hypothetical protein
MMSRLRREVFNHFAVSIAWHDVVAMAAALAERAG